MPKRVDHEERRQHIAAALLRVLARDGLGSASLRHVATEAGVTAGMVQHYFPSKDAMMHFAMQTASARYEQRIAERLAVYGPAPTPAQLIRVLISHLLPTSEAEVDDARVALAFQAYAAHNPDASATLAEGNAVLCGHIGTLLESINAGGPTPVSTAYSLLATADGLAIQVLTARLSSDDADTALATHLDRVLGAESLAT